MMMGWSPSQESTAILGYVDPMPVDQRQDGEPAEGIAVRRHPDLMLMLRAWAYDLVDRFRCGRFESISDSAWSRLSYFESEAVLTMCSARGRAERAAIRDKAGTDG